MKTAASDLSSSLMACSAPDLVMARLLDCGMKRNERSDNSSRNVETERLVRRDQRPPATNNNYHTRLLVSGNISLPRRNQSGREVRAAVRTWSGVLRSATEGTEATEGRGGKPRGGRVKVRTGGGLVVLTEGWKSLITIWLSFCTMNSSAPTIISGLLWSCWAGGGLRAHCCE